MSAIRAEELGVLADAALAAELEYRHQLRLNSTLGVHAADDARHAAAARLLAALDNQPRLVKRRGWGLWARWDAVEGRAVIEALPLRDLDDDLAGRLEAMVGRIAAGIALSLREPPPLPGGYQLPHEREAGPGPGGGAMA